jgi:hypothetical protein
MYLARNEAAMLLFMLDAGKNSRDPATASVTRTPRPPRNLGIDIKLIIEK